MSCWLALFDFLRQLQHCWRNLLKKSVEEICWKSWHEQSYSNLVSSFSTSFDSRYLTLSSLDREMLRFGFGLICFLIRFLYSIFFLFIHFPIFTLKKWTEKSVPKKEKQCIPLPCAQTVHTQRTKLKRQRTPNATAATKILDWKRLVCVHLCTIITTSSQLKWMPKREKRTTLPRLFFSAK